jgi:hypothetical protein
MSIAFLLPEEKSILSCIMFVSQAARRSVRNILNRDLVLLSTKTVQGAWNREIGAWSWKGPS